MASAVPSESETTYPNEITMSALGPTSETENDSVNSDDDQSQGEGKLHGPCDVKVCDTDLSPKTM